MARCFATKSKYSAGDYCFDIDAAVGTGCTNNREDVMLVQYLLAVWKKYRAFSQITPAIFPLLPTNYDDVKVDGIFGEQTKTFIRVFETVHTGVVKPDGRIDPMRTAKTGAKFTKMERLNYYLMWEARGLSGGVPQTRVPFPAVLTQALFIDLG